MLYIMTVIYYDEEAGEIVLIDVKQPEKYLILKDNPLK